jgi:hypothetical protein
MKRQKKTPGSVLLLRLKNGKYSFARIIRDNKICVYDIYSETDTLEDNGGIDGICSRPKLFFLGVYDDVITKGMFEIVGFKELSQKEINDEPPVFTQDILNIDDCTLYYPDGRIVSARKEECIGYGTFSVWEGEGVLDRIVDYYEGRYNFYTENSKVRLK